MPLDAALALGRYLFLVLLSLFVWQLYQAAMRDLRTVRRAMAQAERPAAAARASEPRVMVTQGGGPHLLGQSFLLRTPLTIGRASDNHLAIEDQYASQHHARLSCEGGVMYVEDLGSTNGTLVNHARIQGKVAVTPGTLVSVGECTLRLEA